MGVIRIFNSHDCPGPALDLCRHLHRANDRNVAVVENFGADAVDLLQQFGCERIVGGVVGDRLAAFHNE